MGGRQRILVADDDRRAVAMLAAALRNAGYEVTAADDGYYAMAQILKDKPDLLILDIHMPATSGFDVQERIRRLTKYEDMPIIYISGDSSEQTRQQAERLGAYALMLKPFGIQELLDKIKQALEM
jgi:DNA-binding response OmpR family regulator